MDEVAKYFKPSNYYYKLRKHYLSSRYDRDKEEQVLIHEFEKAGLDYDQAIQKLKDLGRYDALHQLHSIASNHWVLFAAISLSKKVKSILEIGTYDGQTATLLAELFPQSHIVTVDLKDDDPIFVDSYNRENRQDRENFINARNQRLNALKNVTFVQDSSFFILENIPEGETFDFIWVDGAHNNPEVSWDLCNCYQLLNPQGILMCDDVMPHSKNYRDDYVSTDSYSVLDHIQKRRQSTKVHYFLKRNDPNWSAILKKRKYVALLKK